MREAASNNGMQRTRNYQVSHARLVAGDRSCAPLMPSVMPLALKTECALSLIVL
jgi:hypothetical protein